MATRGGDAQRRATLIQSIKRQLLFTQSDQFAAATKGVIKTRLARLAESWKDFQEEHNAIIAAAADDAAIQVHNEVFIDAEDTYYVTSGIFTDKLDELELAAAREEALASLHTHQSAATGGSQRPAGLQLKKLDLPNFRGEPHKWYAFRDTFTAMVHDKPDLSNITKFSFLTAHLAGEAADVLAGFQMSDDNYEEAWNLLNITFDNPRLITMSLIRILRTLKPLTSENMGQLRTIVLKYRQVTRQLRVMNINVDAWDAILTYDLANLLDPATRREWEIRETTTEITPLTVMLDFLEQRANSLSRIAPAAATTSTRHQSQSTVQRQPPAQQRRYEPQRQAVVGHTSADAKCVNCKMDHDLTACPKFIALNPFPRAKRAAQLRVCFGCLKVDHGIADCSCEVCKHCNTGRKHHKLLCFSWADKQKGAMKQTVGTLSMHDVNSETVAKALELQTAPLNAEPIVTCGETATTANLHNVLLATALINVYAPHGKTMVARALCDTGSQANVVTEEIAGELHLTRRSTSTAIQPVGDGNVIPTKGIVTCVISPWFDTSMKITITIDALVVRRISTIMPAAKLGEEKWHYRQLDTVWSQILKASIVKSGDGLRTAQCTHFGWLVFGGMQTHDGAAIVGHVAGVTTNKQLDEALQKFWQLDNIETKRHRSPEEQQCEDVFFNQHYRDDTGRYVVSIPMNQHASTLGQSRPTALERFRKLEQRFNRNHELRRQYVAFMNEYVALGHMEPVDTIADQSKPHYYIPHHAVGKSNKFRVVFDGSCVTSSGQSFNDVQLTGERLQDNLPDILMRFRLWKIALISDAAKMYRQVRINESQYDMQRIVWRPTVNEPIQDYILTTVTYGMRYAPHCAIRALRQCAIDGSHKYPQAADIALRDFYVDDLITGADSEEEALKLYSDMSSLCRMGHFELRKWSTNSWYVMTQLPSNGQGPDQLWAMCKDDTTSVLGVKWNSSNDMLTFAVTTPAECRTITKRIVTSEIAKLFDPTGLLAPTILLGKLLIRQLWQHNLQWDERIPETLANQWNELRVNLSALSNICIPRWTGAEQQSKLQLHGFCDASEKAYAAVVYYRTIQADGKIQCGILTSKTKVAPLKTITIPRLELCGALLLTRLMDVLRQTFNGQLSNETYWSDSTIVLSWLERSPHTLKTFVANGVSEIQESTCIQSWRHVPTKCNPADIASRGLEPAVLPSTALWWNGPEWLSKVEAHWPEFIDNATETPIEEDRPLMVAAMAAVTMSISIDRVPLIDYYSSLSKLKRVTAYVFRFINNCLPGRGQKRSDTSIKHNELYDAEMWWIKLAQQVAFTAEIKACKMRTQLDASSKLCGLKPFVESHGILRAGGRLHASALAYNQKHPIILPSQATITKRLINDAHTNLLHGGVQLTTQFLRNRFWIIGGRNLYAMQFFNVCDVYEKRHN